jgi:rod shape-determining protein MreD
MTTLRRVAQALAVPLALIVAVIAQLVVVNRAPLPGGAAPDLVLLVVTALAVCTGPMTGMLAGFAGGLALDVAPPAAHLAGEYALVFCLVGYACGRARNMIFHATGEQRWVTLLAVMALGTATGEAGKAALGRLVSDPDVTGAAIKHVLPAAIVYDLLLCPFVFWLIALVLRQPAQERAPRPEFAQVATAFRTASAGALGAVPRLRLAGSTPPPARPPVRSEPKLRLSSGRSSQLSGTSSDFSLRRPPVPGGHPAKLNFAQGKSAAARPPAPRRTAPGKGWLKDGQPAGAPAMRSASPGKGWLRTGRPGRPAGMPAARRTSPGKRWLRARRPVGVAPVRSASPGKRWLRAGRPGRQTVAGLRAERPAGVRTSPGKGWLKAGQPAGTPAPRRTSPGKGWIRPAKPVPLPRRRSPGKGWLRPAKPPRPPRRKSPGKGWVRPAKPAARTWYTKPPSTRWVRHSHSPWPERRRRLLGLVGGRR